MTASYTIITRSQKINDSLPTQTQKWSWEVVGLTSFILFTTWWFKKENIFFTTITLSIWFFYLNEFHVYNHYPCVINWANCQLDNCVFSNRERYIIINHIEFLLVQYLIINTHKPTVFSGLRTTQFFLFLFYFFEFLKLILNFVFWWHTYVHNLNSLHSYTYIAIQSSYITKIIINIFFRMKNPSW